MWFSVLYFSLFVSVQAPTFFPFMPVYFGFPLFFNTCHPYFFLSKMEKYKPEQNTDPEEPVSRLINMVPAATNGQVLWLSGRKKPSSDASTSSIYTGNSLSSQTTCIISSMVSRSVFVNIVFSLSDRLEITVSIVSK